MRTMNCPRCGAYTQGDLPHVAPLPVHMEASYPDTEMTPAESMSQPGVCPASEHLVETYPSEKETQ